MRLAADANAIAAELEDANREIERLREYKDRYPPDFIEKLQHDLDVAGIRIEELERERDSAARWG
jgi:hypothetical protein